MYTYIYISLYIYICIYTDERERERDTERERERERSTVVAPARDGRSQPSAVAMKSAAPGIEVILSDPEVEVSGAATSAE